MMNSVRWIVMSAVLCAMAIAQTAAPAPPPAQMPAATPPASTPPANNPPANNAVAPATGSAPASAVPAPAEDQPVTTIVRAVREVNVIFTVTDKHGHFIKNLGQEDVHILDDGKEPEAVRNFSSETNLPLRVGLLIDASNSIRERFKFEQEAAIEFLSSIVRPEKDRAMVIGFDATPEVTADFTNNTEKLSDGVRMLRPGGGTAMYDAVYYACRDKLLKQKDSTAVRRAIILVSDGDDNQSHVSRREAIEMAQRAEVIVYAISTNTSNLEEAGDKNLKMLSEATGGRVFFPFRIEDVSDAFRDIQDELRSQYAVSYKPADFRADGRYRTIQISLLKNKKLSVRARQGYFAPVQ